MKNNKGFIAISLIYSFFLVFLMVLLAILTNYTQERILLNDVKKETQEYLNTIKDFEKKLANIAKVGDYVSLTPTSTSFTVAKNLTGYTSNQTLNPSELNLWRVIKINEDETIEMVSAYVSSVSISFSGQTGYLNLVEGLNGIAAQYGNSKFTMATRYMGYNGQTASITNKTAFITTAPWTSNTTNNSNESIGGGDILYESEANLVQLSLGEIEAYRVNEPTTGADYWIASRYYAYTNANSFSWNGRIVNTSGELINKSLYSYNNRWSSETISAAIRPMVTLKPGITVVSGAGTNDSPYELSI